LGKSANSSEGAALMLQAMIFGVDGMKEHLPILESQILQPVYHQI
jgi:hypothetical protein